MVTKVAHRTDSARPTYASGCARSTYMMLGLSANTVARVPDNRSGLPSRFATFRWD